MDNSIWFKRKRYGWGWTPANLKGWLVVTVYLVFVILPVVISKHGYLDFVPEIYFPVLALSTFALIFVCYKKGESPRWQWGEKDS